MAVFRAIMLTLLALDVAFLVTVLVNHHRWMRRNREAKRARAEAQHITETMRLIGAEQSAELSAAALNACVNLLSETLHGQSES